MYLVLASASRQPGDPPGPEPEACIQPAGADGTPSAPAVVVPAGGLPETVQRLEAPGVRWVWAGTRRHYLPLLRAGVTVERCHDLLLSRAILAHSEFAPQTPYVLGLQGTLPTQEAPPPGQPEQSALFETARPGPPLEDLVQELGCQLAAVAQSPQSARLRLLLAAESAGGLVAAEMENAGVPWRPDVHRQLLTEYLGPRPPDGQRPRELELLAARLRSELNNPGFNPDSPQELLRALHRAGIEVTSTRSWELREHDHPAVATLLRYKKLSRLYTANGWAWLDAWVRDGRFRPEYVAGGVVTGRWASRGGGALQIPRQVRAAARPDPGWKFVVADAAQLEPRVLAALGRDQALAAAARGRDLYQGIADAGFGGDRAQAKVAVLGAMYGATTGESGRLMPRLARTYPQAIAVVERAARAGEAGRVVSSHLGRSCPPPSDRWVAAQRSTTAQEQRRADAAARSRGRFTRNFVVQATAAEWALCWLAELRRRLRVLAADGTAVGELVFFLHDEVMLHVREEHAQLACRLVEESAAAATRLMFGQLPLEFAVSVTVVDSYADAK
ncbi:bifunctional 3'-5' exonuclease/DNA polymerase [Arthrobacter sp. I2-34]|uniref:DNA-directed DNA polymerase n=1 Tax=Arthrobacter hankyongi TaxID=2904801 RepID=A0ABS9LAP7_9MICC|nr:bifunctional 3'-5' exonuclease/DNA polymerase [Arthrobacter hankyongi]MCG2623534.1 bifunctional 3'-5' exonuclease/DNA polymerase [Arthrobacter hankyongi]